MFYLVHKRVGLLNLFFTYNRGLYDTFICQPIFKHVILQRTELLINIYQNAIYVFYYVHTNIFSFTPIIVKSVICLKSQLYNILYIFVWRLLLFSCMRIKFVYTMYKPFEWVCYLNQICTLSSILLFMKYNIVVPLLSDRNQIFRWSRAHWLFRRHNILIYIY